MHQTKILSFVPLVLEPIQNLRSDDFEQVLSVWYCLKNSSLEC